MSILVAALYRFAPLAEPAAMAAPLRALAEAEGVRGTLILAPEGINGTIAGPEAGIEAVLAHLRGWPGMEGLTPRLSRTDTQPFGRMKVRIKREIVTMGVPGVAPAARVGHYVAPQDWNALISAPDVAVIDTRNAYEVAIGSFEGAIDPGTVSFRDFPDWWQRNREALRGKRLAMFCTGGIRCEKATSWLIAEGVEEVYHLQGGILGYLENVAPQESLWQGGCFVFDGRVALGHGLQPTGHSLCHACRRPLDAADLGHPAYEEGVCCPHCVDEYSEADRTRFRERARQMALAEARGTAHLGAELLG